MRAPNAAPRPAMRCACGADDAPVFVACGNNPIVGADRLRRSRRIVRAVRAANGNSHDHAGERLARYLRKHPAAAVRLRDRNTRGDADAALSRTRRDRGRERRFESAQHPLDDRSERLRDGCGRDCRGPGTFELTRRPARSDRGRVCEQSRDPCRSSSRDRKPG